MLEPRNKCMSAALAQMGQQWAKKIKSRRSDEVDGALVLAPIG
jgi:hypothetical protein